MFKNLSNNDTYDYMKREEDIILAQKFREKKDPFLRLYLLGLLLSSGIIFVSIASSFSGLLFVLIGLPVPLGLVIIEVLLQRRFALSHAHRTYGALGSQRLILEDEGIRLKNAGQNCLYRWHHIKKIFQYKNQCYIFFRSNRFIQIPMRDLDEEKVQEFIRKLTNVRKTENEEGEYHGN